jgi:hypothetical protein
MKYLHAYTDGTGPHINFTHSPISKVASEVLRKSALRKVN